MLRAREAEAEGNALRAREAEAEGNALRAREAETEGNALRAREAETEGSALRARETCGGKRASREYQPHTSHPTPHTSNLKPHTSLGSVIDRLDDAHEVSCFIDGGDHGDDAFDCVDKVL